MNKFAFLVHPRDNVDFLRRFPHLSLFPERFIAFLTRNMPPVVVSEITGLKNKDGKPIEGLLGEIPLIGDNFDQISALVNLTHAMEIEDASCIRRRSALSA